MIYTSYFGKTKKWVGLNAVSIASVVPFWKGYSDSELMPPEELLYDYKNGLINEEQYTIRYRQEVLSKLDPDWVGRFLEGCILLCYEKTGRFCHRHIVADWLREAGFEVKELDDNDLKEMLTK